MTFLANSAVFIDSSRILNAGKLTVVGTDTSIYVNDKPFFQGQQFGYSSGGITTVGVNTIDRYPYTSDTNASDVGDLTRASYYVSGLSSDSQGYCAGGDGAVNTIDKFPFAISSAATDVGDLTIARSGSAGVASQYTGYVAGGGNSNPAPPPSFTSTNTIDRFSFASNSNAVDAGNKLTGRRVDMAGISSYNFGYLAGGQPETGSAAPLNTLEKFPFASTAVASSVGSLTAQKFQLGGNQSDTSGYVVGGFPETNTIQKFPFATDSSSTNTAVLPGTNYNFSSSSSTVSGYSAGGIRPPVGPGGINIIEKFSFVSDTNATNVGTLSQSRYGVAGQQY